RLRSDPEPARLMADAAARAFGSGAVLRDED
ncbi:MAG: spermidine synthase, partial [Gordonia sp.]|nr:spermidine synthase [Gordonia sp. (in: high G+C Gram-positive bacteria)]